MKKLIWSIKSKINVENYITNYRGYFFNLYSDTGIWSENAILENYNIEGKQRYTEIIDSIEKRLSPDIVLGRTLVNSLLLPWRSKVILVIWEDTDDGRRIVDLQIH